jgi:purine-binding chemotaxis protein CheW
MVSNTAVAAEAGMPAPAATPWVVFRCADGHYGVPLDQVSEILSPRPFTRLPGTGPEVCGLVALRGRVITVFDLGVILGLRGAASLPEHRLLLFQHDARRIGAAVEDVVDIAPARLDASADASGVVGTGHTDETTFTALDPHVLLARLLQTEPIDTVEEQTNHGENGPHLR